MPLRRAQGSAAFVCTSLAVALCLGCLQGGGPQPPPPPPQVQWLKQAAKPFATTDPAAGDGDLAVLGPMVGPASLVGLGEATHGSAEFFRMKHRIFRYLVERHGFTGFGLEADQAQCRALDRHVLTGEGDPRALVAGLGMWPWGTEEMLDLVAWMRAYNAGLGAGAGDGAKVRFFGIDMQDGAAALANLLDYLGKVDPPARLAMMELLMPMAPFLGIDNRVGRIYPGASRELQNLCRAAILEARLRLLARKAGYVAAGGAEAYAWALQMAELLDQYEACLRAGEFRPTLMVENLRDRFMADNALWALGQLGPGAKAVLWAHNGHVNRTGTGAPLWKNTGEWLSRHRRLDYLALGFAFGAGAFNAEPGDGGPVRAFRANPPGPGSYEDAFLQAGPALAFLDLRELDLTHAGARWFSEPHLFREVGSSFGPADPPEGLVSCLADRFDVLVFMRNVTASRLIPLTSGGAAESSPTPGAPRPPGRTTGSNGTAP